MTENAVNYIGANIRKERIKAGLDQARLAQAVGLAQTAISRFENGSRRPSVELLKRIAAVLGCSFAALVDEDGKNGNFVKTSVRDGDDTENAKNEPAKFVQSLLAKNPEMSVHLRSLAGRSGELAPEDWQFLADHLTHVFIQVQNLLDRGNKK